MEVEIERGTVGGAFEDFLKEQGTFRETKDQALRRVLAFQRARSAQTQVDLQADGIQRSD